MNENFSAEVMPEGEIDELASRLDAMVEADRMTLEGVDGLFCALSASADLVSPSAYLPMVLEAITG